MGRRWRHSAFSPLHLGDQDATTVSCMFVWEAAAAPVVVMIGSLSERLKREITLANDEAAVIAACSSISTSIYHQGAMATTTVVVSLFSVRTGRLCVTGGHLEQ